MQTGGSYALGVALLLLPSLAVATTWHVNPAGTGDFPNIQSAVYAAADGDEILLDDGMFTGPGNGEITFLGKAISVRSASGNADACVIDEYLNSAFRYGNGGWYLGGSFTAISGVARNGLARVHADWSLDDWAPAVAPSSARVGAIVVTPTKVFVGRYFTSIDGQPRSGLAAFDANSGALLPWNPGIGGGPFPLATSLRLEALPETTSRPCASRRGVPQL